MSQNRKNPYAQTRGSAGKINNPQNQRRSVPGYGVSRNNTPRNGYQPQNRPYSGSAYYGRGYSTYEERNRKARIEAERKAKALREQKLRLKQEMKRQKKQKRRRARQVFFGRFTVFIAVFAILAVISGIVFALYFNSTPDAEKSSKIEYVIGTSSVRTVPYDTAFKNGCMYICFNDVAKYLSMAVTGDSEGMKFIITDENASDGAGTGKEETLIFEVDSRTVIINGQKMTLDANSFLYGDEIWVSGDFVKDYIDGITLNYNPGKNTISVSRVADEELSDDENTVYRKVTLKIKSSDPIPALTSEGGNTSVPEVTFSQDLSSYEEYMNPANSSEYLVLVNTEHTLDASFVPEDLADITNTRQDGRETQKLRSCAARALEALFLEMNAAGFTDVSVTSGYRSYEYQKNLFNGYVQEEMSKNPALSEAEAENLVASYSSRPGTSEHQSGLCVDMHNLPGASVEFSSEAAYNWLDENAWKFGFILRYPEAKTDITGISYEPWHWRFVGREHAYKIHSASLCLEEYVSSLNT